MTSDVCSPTSRAPCRRVTSRPGARCWSGAAGLPGAAVALALSGAAHVHQQAAAAFTELRDRASFWHWPVALRATTGGTRAALHAKIIAADTRIALVSSANLTDRALTGNLEVGVVLRSPVVLRRLVDHFSALMHTPAGPLQRLP